MTIPITLEVNNPSSDSNQQKNRKKEEEEEAEALFEERERGHDIENDTMDHDEADTAPTATLPTVVFSTPPRSEQEVDPEPGPICLGIVLNSQQDSDNGRFETTKQLWYLFRRPKIMPRTQSILLHKLEELYEIVRFGFLVLTTCCPDRRCWINIWQTPIRILLILPGLLIGVPMEVATLLLLLICAIPVDLIRGHRKFTSSTDDGDLFLVYKSRCPPGRRHCLHGLFLEKWDRIPTAVENTTRVLINERLETIKIRFHKQQDEDGQFYFQREQLIVERE